MNNRRLMIMRLLDSRKKCTARELAERFQVSIRTIQRDLDYLQQIGVPLYTEVGVNGGYRVLPNRILPPLQLNQQEALGLYMMFEYLEQVPDFPYGSIRAQLAEHYFVSLPSDVQDMIIRMRQHITFLQHHSVQQETEPITTQILGAAVEKTAIEFMYAARSGMKLVRVYPLGIYYENGYWYMPAKKQERILLYRVDRMKQLNVFDQSNNGLPTLKEWLISNDERESVEVVLRFTDFGERLAVSDPLFTHVQHKEWRGQVSPDEFPFVARRLLSYGPEVKVITPPQLQTLIVEMLELNLGQYKY
ncbi:WYL domain-containing protein [Paenibacillus sp. ACRRX]|uniref:helix-turn-helix transcriptional regulator n=1 Tax=Paenibacillus sp. ACRRX TaxID=2918206 RepID=UPI001EF6B51F|nr:WYL domain-containing protein [Paenibacillus sp. ACRRX]MCG7409212.1 WYL domain-containing protein [Paenibacillus sp. ACRRX]